MQVELALPEVLRRYGISIQGKSEDLGDAIGYGRQAVSRLVNGRLSAFKLDRLGALCDWLLKELADRPERLRELRAELPGCLFRVSGLWARLLEAEEIVTVLGEKKLIRRDPGRRPLAYRWVSSADYHASSRIVQALSHAGSPANFSHLLAKIQILEDAEAAGPHELESYFAADRGKATDKFQRLRASISPQRRSAHIYIGSQKVSLLLELYIGSLFEVDVFQHPEGGSRVPIWVHYRPGDLQLFQSCFGGLRPPPGGEDDTPGIHYRKPDGTWQVVPFGQTYESPGVVIVEQRALHTNLALFGFSGRGTDFLSQAFLRDPDRFWPSQQVGENRLQVYVCQRLRPPTEERDADFEHFEWQVVPVLEEGAGKGKGTRGADE